MGILTKHILRCRTLREARYIASLLEYQDIVFCRDIVVRNSIVFFDINNGNVCDIFEMINNKTKSKKLEVIYFGEDRDYIVYKSKDKHIQTLELDEIKGSLWSIQSNISINSLQLFNNLKSKIIQ